MGYYSNFNIEVKLDKDCKYDESMIDNIIQEIADSDDCTNPYEEFHYLDFYPANGSWFGNMKWYTCEEDMKELSKDFPGVLFIVSVKGEECGDLWKLYAKEGKTQRCNVKIIYDEYKPELMQ